MIHMIKSSKEVTFETLETYFLYRKPQELKILNNVLLGKSHSAEQKRKVTSYPRNNLGVSFKNGVK